jgi:HK97 family phage major capsid protein
MQDDMTELQSITHEYRKSLAAYEARTGRATHTVDSQGSGEERQKFARMDADLSAVEATAQVRALEARLAKLESQPVLESRLTARPTALGNADDPNSPAYSARWLKAMVNNDHAEMRALSLASTNAGIPTDMERRIVERLREANIMRSIAVVTQIDSKRTITVENALPSTSLISEAASITASDPTFSTAISVVPYKYATRVTISQEFIEDAIGQNGIGSALDYVAQRAALSIALKQEEAYTIGTGSSQPQGITASGGIAQGVDLGAAVALTTTTADNLVDAMFAVKPAYRNSPRFRWLISDEFLKHVRKLKNTVTTSGQLEYIWTPGTATVNQLVGGLPATILGVPYSVGQYMPTTTASDAIYAVIGDFNYFEIFDRTGITSMVDPYSNAATHQTNLILYTRTDSKIMLPEAFAYIRG